MRCEESGDSLLHPRTIRGAIPRDHDPNRGLEFPRNIVLTTASNHIKDVNVTSVTMKATALPVSAAPSSPIWIGLDVGTQGCRAVAIDSVGVRRAEHRYPLHSRREADRHEQDPMDWIEGARTVLRGVSDQLGPDAAAVGALAICGTSGTVLVADRAMRPLTAGLMYDDARGYADAPALVQWWADCAARNAYRIQPTWALAKLAWLVRTSPSVRSGRLYHVADFVGSQLAGEPVAADSSHALKSGYDLVRDTWPAEELDRAGIPIEMMPPVVRPGTAVGTIGDSSEVIGLPAGTPIVAGMTDGCASQIAAGTVHPGQWNSALGTTLVLKGVSKNLVRDPDGAVYSHRHPDGGWLPGGASSSGAGSLAAAFGGRDPADLDRLAEPLLPSAVLSYPIASPGERFPFVRPDAEPFQIGAPRGEGDLAASLMQGVAFVERLCLSHLADLGADTSGALSITGGATNSALWNQLRADVLGRVLRLPRNAEAAAGAAIIAAARDQSVTSAAERMVSDVATIEPRADSARRWHETYLGMVDELERRGYIRRSLAEAARAA